jgi:H+/Cl- antiporter ClcA
MRFGRHNVSWRRLALYVAVYVAVGILWGLLVLFGEQGPILVPDWHDPADWWWVMSTAIPLWPIQVLGVWALALPPALLIFLVGWWVRRRIRADLKSRGQLPEDSNL